jgi:hypothetical protein
MKRVGLLLVVAVVVFIGLPAPAWAQQGNQRFIGISTVPGATTGTVFATGPITGVGTFAFPNGSGPLPGQLAFDDGTVSVTIVPSPSPIDSNPRTCLVRVGLSGTFQVTGGTERFSGASGSGTYTGRAFVLLARGADGECDPEGQPQFSFGVVNLTGNVSVPGQVPGMSRVP